MIHVLIKYHPEHSELIWRTLLEPLVIWKVTSSEIHLDEPFRLFFHRTTELTSSCGSAGTTPGWSFHQISSPILWLSTPKCLNVCGNLTCSSPTRRAPTSMTSPRRTSSCLYSGMETFWLVWGSRLVEFYDCFFVCVAVWELSQKILQPCKDKNEKKKPLFPGIVWYHIFRTSFFSF